MIRVKHAIGWLVRIGGEQHTGWLPGGAARPLPTPIRDVRLDVEIQFDGHGYLLCYSAQDGSVYGDAWHETQEEAELAAEERFGVRPGNWEVG